MPRNLCLERPAPRRIRHTSHVSRFQRGHTEVAAELARQRASANRWTLVLAGLSIVCATAEALWMSVPWV